MFRLFFSSNIYSLLKSLGSNVQIAYGVPLKIIYTHSDHFLWDFYQSEIKQNCPCITLNNLNQWFYVCLVCNYSINSVAFKEFTYLMYVKLKAHYFHFPNELANYIFGKYMVFYAELDKNY